MGQMAHLTAFLSGRMGHTHSGTSCAPSGAGWEEWRSEPRVPLRSARGDTPGPLRGPPCRPSACVTRVDAGKWAPRVSCATTRGSAYPCHPAKHVWLFAPFVETSGNTVAFRRILSASTDGLNDPNVFSVWIVPEGRKAPSPGREPWDTRPHHIPEPWRGDRNAHAMHIRLSPLGGSHRRRTSFPGARAPGYSLSPLQG